MLEIKSGRLDQYGAEDIRKSKCNHMMTVDFKGLTDDRVMIVDAVVIQTRLLNF